MPLHARLAAGGAALLLASCAGGDRTELAYPASGYSAGGRGYAASEGVTFGSVSAQGGAMQRETLAEAPPPSDAPQASSQRGPGANRYDEVGYAEVGDLAEAGSGSAEQVAATSSTLLPGNFAEVTALDSGRTILLLVSGQSSASDAVIALSPAAARQLGVGDAAPVRVRRVSPSVADQAALRAGRAAPLRPDAPPPLLAGLRRMLPEARTAAVAVTAPARRDSTAAAAEGRIYVQVAALSNESRARSLAVSLTNGLVRSAGNLYRVQMGPFATTAQAERARAEAVRRGFRDARILD